MSQIEIYDSLAALFNSSNTGTDRLINRSTFGSWQGTANGPRGQTAWHRSAAVSSTPSAPGDEDAMYALLAARRFYDAQGDAFDLSLDKTYVIEDFMGKRGLSNDITKAVQTMGDALGYVRLSPGRDSTMPYRMDGTAEFSNQSIDLDFSGSDIKHSGDVEAFDIRCAYKNGQSITAFEELDIDLSGGTSGTTKVSVVSVPDSSGYTENSFAKVISADFNEGSNESNTERRGEFAHIQKIISNKIYFSALLRETYITSPQIFAVEEDYRVSITGSSGSISSMTASELGVSESSLNGNNKPLIRLTGIFQPTIRDIYTFKSYSEFLTLEGCIGALTSGLNLRNLVTSSALNRVGYGVVSYCSEYGIHLNPFGANLRHLYTTGTRGSTPGDNKPEHYGRTAFEIVDGVRAIGCTSAALDMHCDAYAIQFRNGVITNSFSGTDGSNVGVGLRGKKSSVSGIHVEGGRGFVVTADHDVPGNCTKHTLTNCSYAASKEVGATDSAVEVNGQETCIPELIINGFEAVGGLSTAAVVKSDYGKIRISKFDIEVNHQGSASSGRVFEASHGSAISCVGGLVRYGDLTTATGLRLAILTNDNDVENEVYFTNKFEWKDGEIEVNGKSLSSLIDFKSSNTNDGFIRGLTMDSAPSASTKVSNLAGSACSIDYVINNARAAGFSQFSATFTTTGVKALDFGVRGCQCINARIITNAGSVSIDTLSPGKIENQQLILTNSAASTNSLTLTDNASGLVSVDASVVIAPGRQVRLFWDIVAGLWVN